jgi:hypothetical protein
MRPRRMAKRGPGLDRTRNPRGQPGSGRHRAGVPGALRQGRDHIGRALPHRAPRRRRSLDGLLAGPARVRCRRCPDVPAADDRRAVRRPPRRRAVTSPTKRRAAVNRQAAPAKRTVCGTHWEVFFAANTTWDAGSPFARREALSLCLVGRFRPAGGGAREIDPIVELGERNLDVDLG